MVKDPLKSVQLNLKLTWKILLQKVCQTAGFNFLSLTAQGYEFSRLNAIYFKNPQNSDFFSWRNSFEIAFWFIRKVESFQLSTKFRFLTT